MATKKTPIKAHRGFVHIPKRGLGGGDKRRRRPPRDPFNPFKPRRPKNIPLVAKNQRPTTSDVQPAQRIAKIPTTSDVQPAQRIAKRPTELVAPAERVAPAQRVDTTSVRPATRMPTVGNNQLAEKQMRELMQRQLSAASKQNRTNTGRARPPKNMGAMLRGQQRAADNFKRLRDIAFRRSASAQRRAKGGVMVKTKDYVNPSSTMDKRKKK